MEEKQKEFSKKINLEKAFLNINAAIIALFLSILTYIIPHVFIDNFNGFGASVFFVTTVNPTGFDFGIIFEIISFIFLILTRIFIKKNDEVKSRKFIVFSIIPIVILLLYDIVWIVFSISDLGEMILYSYYFWIGEGITISALLMMLLTLKALSKAEDPEKYKESSDWFYEKYEDK